MAQIHPTAMIGERVTLGEGVIIGPQVIIGDDVTIGDGTSIGAFSAIGSLTTLGRDCKIGMWVQLGGDPQILGWEPVGSKTIIGDRCEFREYATVHRAKHEGEATVIGDECYVMVNAHVAHDCRLGNGVILANGALVAGHSEIGDRTFISGNCAIHQNIRVGRLVMMQGLSATSKDVPPFHIMTQTHTLRGLNLVGLRRSGMSKETIDQIKKASQRIFDTERPMKEVFVELEQEGTCPEVQEMIDFIRAAKKGIATTP